MKIRVITPVITREMLIESEREFGSVARSDTELSHTILEHGPASIESEYDEALALPDMLRLVKHAQVEGIDAVIINCASDPGLDAARELASIPVIGVAQAAFSLAAVLAQKFSVLAILQRDIPDLDRLFRLYGLTDRIASIRVINSPVLELLNERDNTLDSMTEAALTALQKDRAEAITVDCTGLSSMVKELRSRLLAEGFDAPVIDPVAASVKLAESLVDLGLCHSKLTYPDPPEKKIIPPL